MPTEQKSASQEIQIDDNTTTLFVDGAFVNHRHDGMSFIRLTVGLPNGAVGEQARIMVGDEHLQRIIDVLCKSINYYPKKRPLKTMK